MAVFEIELGDGQVMNNRIFAYRRDQGQNNNRSNQKETGYPPASAVFGFPDISTENFSSNPAENNCYQDKNTIPEPGLERVLKRPGKWDGADNEHGRNNSGNPHAVSMGSH